MKRQILMILFMIFVIRYQISGVQYEIVNYLDTGKVEMVMPVNRELELDWLTLQHYHESYCRGNHDFVQLFGYPDEWVNYDEVVFCAGKEQ